MGLLSNFRNRSAAPETNEPEAAAALDFDFDDPLPLDGSDDDWLQAVERRRPASEEVDPFLAGGEANVPAAVQPEDNAPAAPAEDVTPVQGVAPSLGAEAQDDGPSIEHSAPATMRGGLPLPGAMPMMPMTGAPQFPTEAPDVHVASQGEFDQTDAHVVSPGGFDQTDAHIEAPEPAQHAPAADIPVEPTSAPAEQFPPLLEEEPPVAFAYAPEADTYELHPAPVETYEFHPAPLTVPVGDEHSSDVDQNIEEAQPAEAEPLPDLGMVFAGLSNEGIVPMPAVLPAPLAAPLNIVYGPLGPQAMPHLQTMGLSVGVSWQEVTLARRALLGQNPADGTAEQQFLRSEVNHASATLRLLRVGPLLPA